MSGTKVPPGWVRLTDREDGSLLVAARAIETVTARLRVGTQVMAAGRQYTVTESPSEVAALIAAAQAAERRARALPVMAAILWGCEIASAERAGICTDEEIASRNADAILDAIERRERDDG